MTSTIIIRCCALYLSVLPPLATINNNAFSVKPLYIRREGNQVPSCSIMHASYTVALHDISTSTW